MSPSPASAPACCADARAEQCRRDEAPVDLHAGWDAIEFLVDGLLQAAAARH